MKPTRSASLAFIPRSGRVALRHHSSCARNACCHQRNGGRYALVSIWENEGALVIYDAAIFAEIKRIPMSRPSGKYNVWNKISFSDGTSH
jgi:hypothetical protein